MMKKFLALLGAVVVGGAVLSACGETEVKDVSGDKKEEAKEEKKDENKVYGVGDTVSVDGMEITIKSAKFTDPTQYTKAKNGKVLTLEVTAKNSNDEQAFIDNSEFAVYDKDGNKVDDYFGYDEIAISGNVNAGKQMQGKVYFDVPEQDSYELLYTPSFSMDSKEVKFDIKVK
ncbi:DUF4352 domain-containing protein [Bacillus haynesii]|uniref:DUF4352 domain-containing protein n=2 Tax=Bacillus haynesii TaxID=1925021 RepID=UPI00227DAF6F|nr:DUF4352 domain-containing protein [Bacillus haynesii]MCY8668823.1 DUF4352 domain-containing protein [Bacillus haynesii]